MLSTLPLLAVLLACNGDDEDVTKDGSPPDTGDTGPSDLFVVPPEVLAPEALVGGARRIVVASAEPATLELQLTGPGASQTITWPEATDFEVPLVGLRPDAEHELTLTLTAESGERAVRTVSITGDTLPPNVPDLDVLSLDAAAVSPGHTLFATTTPAGPGAWLLLLDPEGQPVWWTYWEVRIGGVELTEDGTLLGLGGATIVELDWLGEVRRHYTSEPGAAGTPIPGASYVHHEVVPLPDGHLLTLDHVPVAVDDLPADYTDLTTLGPGTVADDRVLELDENGEIVSILSLVDRLPTSRISFDSLTPQNQLGGAADWAHTNALALDDDGWVLSLRHQDALVKLDENGDVAWILGDPAGWPSPWSEQLLVADGPLAWPYHQHAPELHREADGLHILLFDNVNLGHTPYTPFPGERPSRLVEYVVDEGAGTVRQAWSYEMEPEGPLDAIALGDADRMDNGNVLGVWGMLTAEDGVENADQGRGNFTARIAEVNPDDGAVVFDLRVGWDRARGVEGWTVYRAARLPKLYPLALDED